MEKHCSNGRGARRLFAGGLVLVGMACAFPAEEGPAYEPWTFPDQQHEGPWELVHAALLSASPHNTQPWRFVVGTDRIQLYADDTRSLGAMDPLHREMYIGLGCSEQNLLIAARHQGYAPTPRYMPDPLDPSVVADIALSPATGIRDEPLFDAIARRHTNRGYYADLPLDSGIKQALRALVAEEPGVTIRFIEGPTEKESFRQGTIEATRRIVDDDEMLAASDAWWRQTHEEIETHRDGLTVDAQGLSATKTYLSKVTSRLSAKESGRYWIDNTEKIHTKALSAYVILATPTISDPAMTMAVGRAYQHLHLWCTQNGLALQPLNQMAERRDREMVLGLDPEFGRKLQDFEPAGAFAQMLFRVGYPFDDIPASPRRPVEWVAGDAP